MHDDVTVIDQHPPILRLTFHAPLKLMVFFKVREHILRQHTEHAVAGTRAYHKIISKIGNFMNIEQENVLSFFILQNINNDACYF